MGSTLTAIMPDNKNGQKGSVTDFPIQSSKKLEANLVFPSDPRSSYISDYYRPSGDFPYNPDPLASANRYDIYDEMRHDDQVKSAISFKKDLIIGSGWNIKCEVPEISEAIEKNLREKLARSFEDCLRDILSNFEYGFSLTEVLFRHGEDGLIEVKDLKTRPPHTFEFYLDTKGDVEKIIQNADTGVLDFKPDYFLHHIYQPEFGNPYGQSDLRAAHQAWKAKKFFFRMWAIYVERFASPTVIGEYPENFDSSKTARLQAIMNTIQNSTNLIVPEGTKIDFKMPNRDSSNVYENAINLLNTMIARAILMPDLLGVSGEQTSGGSYSLGQTQFELFMTLVKREQQSLSRVITKKIVQPIVKANWGDYPAEFEFRQHSKEDALESLKVWSEATRARIWKTDTSEIKHFLETLKFPSDHEIEISEPTQPNPNFPGFPGNEEKGQKPGEAEEEEKDEDEEKEESDSSPIKMFREKTTYEKLINFQQIDDFLASQDEKAFKKLKPAAKDIYIDYINQIRERNLLNRFKPELINELTVRFQKPMNQEFKFFMRDTYTESYNEAQKDLLPKSSMKFATEEELLPEEFIEVIDAEAFKLVGDYSIQVPKKMRDRLMQGIKNGVNERDLLKQLKELGESETDKWLKTVIRTKSTEMYNRARKSYWDNDDIAKQMVVAYQYSAILDNRTSEVCRSLDGKIFDKGEYATTVNPPLHFNCRSVLVPITKFEEYKLDKEISLEKLKGMGGNLIV